MMMSKWQISANPTGNEHSLVIGFDMGTSCTKIVIQDADTENSFAIPLAGNCHGDPFLLSTTFFVNPDGSIHLEHGKRRVKGLKVRLTFNPEGIFLKDTIRGGVNPIELAAAYVGLVLKRIQKWFLSNKKDDYLNNSIKWQMNIGVSSRNTDNSQLSENMRIIGLAGWNLSLLDSKQLFLTDVKRAVETARNQLVAKAYDPNVGQIHPDYVNAFPEIIAEVIGYMKSPYKQDGMYLLIDIGSSTLDVSTFTCYAPDEDDAFSIWTAEVERLGVMKLHQHRIQKIKGIAGADMHNFPQFDGITAIPSIETYVNGLSIEDLNEIDQEFFDECSRLIRRVLRETKEKRNPLAPEWNSVFPVFLCGGGALLESYKQLIKDVTNKLAPANYDLHFSNREIPIPNEICSGSSNLNRIAVAYGLSYPRAELGPVKSPEAIEDFFLELKVKDVDELYIEN